MRLLRMMTLHSLSSNVQLDVVCGSLILALFLLVKASLAGAAHLTLMLLS